MREDGQWEYEWLRQTNLDAIEAAFVEQEVKDRIAAKVRAWVAPVS